MVYRLKKQINSNNTLNYLSIPFNYHKGMITYILS